METVALIPARGGSKSMPGKNIRSFAGKPLIAASITTGLAAPSVSRVVVSTDCEEIAAISREFGAETPFIRPAEHAQDDTPDLPAFRHCLEWLREDEGYAPEIVVQLRPTSPLRTPEMVEEGIRLLRDDPNADSVRCVCEPSQSPFKMWTVGSDRYLQPLVKTDIVEQYNQPRQLLPEVYWQNGYVDITRPATILEKNSMTGERILPLVVDPAHVLDIDDELTFRMAEAIYRERDESGQ